MIFLYFISLSLSIFAVSITDVEKCVQEKFGALKNRNATSVAVVSLNKTSIYNYGAAKDDSIYEIGSITKTFTGNLLAQAILRDEVKLSDPIPEEYQKKPAVITYQQLTTHSSGIKGGALPDQPVGWPTPYRDVTVELFKQLYSKLALSSEPGSKWEYSNIATGLLGLILSEKASSTYEELVTEKILTPLNMKDTYFKVPLIAQHRFLNGFYNQQPFPHWDLFDSGYSGAGALRSTITDMARYAHAQLFPDSTALTASIKLGQKPLYKVQKSWMGFNWFVRPEEEIIFHDGLTFGFESMMLISLKNQLAIVALSNSTFSNNAEIVDLPFACLK